MLGGRSLEQVERSFKSLLVLQIDSVARACELSAAQREKLQLAGEYDLKRMSREMSALREKFNEGRRDQQKYNDLVNEASMMQTKLQTGIYGELSFFQKVLGQTLSRDQSLRYEQQERQRRKFRYQARIELVVSNLEGSVSLTGDQRRRLVKLLVDETEPPKKFGQYDTYVVFYNLGKLDEAKLKPILDDSQRKSLKRLISRFGGMKQILQSQGYLP